MYIHIYKYMYICIPMFVFLLTQWHIGTRPICNQLTLRLAPLWFSMQANCRVFPLKSEMHFYCYCCFCCCSQSNLKRLSCKKGPETKTCRLLLRFTLNWDDCVEERQDVLKRCPFHFKRVKSRSLFVIVGVSSGGRWKAGRWRGISVHLPHSEIWT